MEKRIQAKNLDERAMLVRVREACEKRGSWAFRCDFEDFGPSKVVPAKLKSMIKKGLITGCACGCGRGDFTLTERGSEILDRKDMTS